MKTKTVDIIETHFTNDKVLKGLAITYNILKKKRDTTSNTILYTMAQYARKLFHVNKACTIYELANGTLRVYFLDYPADGKVRDVTITPNLGTAEIRE